MLAPLSIEDGVKFGAHFMSHFLFIHPFENGNGRVARLLLSWILAPTCILPLPVYASAHYKDVYLDALRQSREFVPYKPDALARLILESLHRSTRNICECLDLFEV